MAKQDKRNRGSPHRQEDRYENEDAGIREDLKSSQGRSGIQPGEGREENRGSQSHDGSLRGKDRKRKSRHHRAAASEQYSQVEPPE
jgi:hypothetical protein